MICFGRFFVEVDFARELFWTDRKDGGRLYHFFNFGIYDMSHLGEGCGAISLTVLFASFKFGWIGYRSTH